MPEEPKEARVPNKVMVMFYTALLALGLIHYTVWGLLYGTWNIFERTSLGVYTATVLLCGFGIVGIILYRIKDRSENTQ